MRSEAHPSLFSRPRTARTDGIGVDLPQVLVASSTPPGGAATDPAPNPENASIGLGLTSSFSAPGDGPR